MGGKSRWDLLQKRVVACRRCPRLRTHCEEVARTKRAAYRDHDYWGKPVPDFGAADASLLIVGLAPGAHGANRTGRMFTGDRSGDFLYRALYETGFANQPESVDRADGLVLEGAAITAVARCAPPKNRPTAEELRTCYPFFNDTVELLNELGGFVALGRIAFDGCIRLFRERGWLEKGRKPKFAHGAVVEPPNGPFLIASFHPSQQNTFTGRLTMEMFTGVFADAAARIADRAG